MTPEQRHIARVMSLPCVLELAGYGASCDPRVTQSQRQPGYEYHHLREDQGASERADAFIGVKFCWGHHVGPNGFHGLGRRAFETRYRLSELDLLAITLRALEIQRQIEMTRVRAA